MQIDYIKNYINLGGVGGLLRMKNIVNTLTGQIIRASNIINSLMESRDAVSPMISPGIKKPIPTPNILTTDNTDVAAGR